MMPFDKAGIKMGFANANMMALQLLDKLVNAGSCMQHGGRRDAF